MADERLTVDKLITILAQVKAEHGGHIRVSFDHGAAWVGADWPTIVNDDGEKVLSINGE